MMTQSTYRRKRREMMSHVTELKAQIDKFKAQIAELDRQPLAEPKRRATRIPQWCKPWWERRDGAQHVVYCTARRRRDAEPTTAYWLWRDGEPRAKASTLQGIKALARLRSMMFDTYVWDASQWDEYKAAHPEIDGRLRKSTEA